MVREKTESTAQRLSNIRYFGLPSPPPFASETLEKWDAAAFASMEKFIVQEQRHGSTSVNVFNVIGTKHHDYAGKTWLNLLENGRRMHENLPLFEENPGYYLETATKAPYMHLISIDGGSLYIGEEGNHRTCIARFFFLTRSMSILHGVSWQDFRIDWHFKELCDELKSKAERLRLPISIDVYREMLERRDAADWRLDIFKLVAKVYNGQTGETMLLDAEGLEEYIDKLGRSWWRRAFLKG